ncbi:MAG TPA: OmpA family protein [Saprospiraceae bacterium]|nr:OmpA family protein [Saprospiraceae bacterium]
MRNFLIAIIILLYLILGWLYYQNHNQCCTGDLSNVPKENSILATSSGPLLFSYNSSTPVTGNGWPSMRDSLAGLITDTTSLEITGWYCTNLTPPETEEIATGRANETKLLFDASVRDKITVVTKGVDCSDSRINMNDVAASFAQRVTTAHIQEVADKTIIYFGYNSTSRLDNKNVEAYLDQVAERVIKSGESILLTGHTDNIGSDAANLVLGKKRADTVKQYLISKGVASGKIKVESKGKTEPIADNSTDEGRAKNRRTELQVIQ